MLATIFEDSVGRGFGALAGLVFGSGVTFAIARWKRHREKVSVHRGDARNTVVIHHHIVESASGTREDGSVYRRPTVLRVRSLGQEQLNQVVPNGHLAAVLLRRASRVTAMDSLIAMDGPEGSYLLETLTNWVGHRVANAPFSHDLYVMTPCCEPRELALHQPISLLLISVADLELFLDWPTCKNVRVEHGSEGARVLTLMKMAQRFRSEQSKIVELRTVGHRTRYVETMYILDLPLDRTTAPIPTKEIPWNRFESILKRMNLE